MKFTLSWLRDHLETDASLDTISTALTALGLEVEAVDDPAARLAGFVVAEIVEAAPHPNASKLQVCRVNDGSSLRQIVCGAANARAGLRTVLAREGVFIPGSGITIKKTKIRDVESNGMLCSAEELGLAEQSEGILELPADSTPGAPASDALGVNDPVIEIAVTPNRADCLGVRGIARDLAAAGIGALKPLPEISLPAPGAPALPIRLETCACTLFLGWRITGVKNGPSPAWLQARLRAIGLKPISALVDITNYFAFTFARPLHAYDAAKLKVSITVREARAGEALCALNGKEYALIPGMTVIADEARVLALGGVIGGEETGVSDATTEVLLETALFDAPSIAKAGRALDLITDARYRFERSVDAGFAEEGAKRAVAMILELCGGAAAGFTKAGDANPEAREIPFTPARVKTLGGVDVPPGECERILHALGFRVNGGTVVPPGWRSDVEGPADVVEEILRIHGYDNVPAAPLPAAPAATPSPQEIRARSARRALAARGMLEACTYSFLPHAQAEMFDGGAEELRLKNPISTELDTLRPSLLPNLLAAAARNQNHGTRDVALFELGVTFSGVLPQEQQTRIGGVRAGGLTEHSYPDARFSLLEREVDVFDAKADAFAALGALGVNTTNLMLTRTAPAWYHPGRSATLMQGKNVLGWFGALHPALAARFGLEGGVACFELALDAVPLPRAKGKARAAFAPSPYPAVTRDFAFILEEKITAAELVKAASDAQKALIQDVRVFDVYSGKGVEPGRKSVALAVTLQAMDRTLSETEITAACDAIIQAAASLGGALRQ